MCQAVVFAQNQSIADSLEIIYNQNIYSNEEKLPILKDLTFYQLNTDKKLTQSTELIQLARELDSVKYLYHGYLQKGNALKLKSEMSSALESYIEAAKIAMEENWSMELGATYITIADVYSIMKNHDNAVSYYRNAISILREANDSIKLASALLNAGDEYFNQRQLDSALAFFEESGKIFRAIDYEIGVAYNLGNVGMVYAEQGKDAFAQANINEAIIILERLEDFYPISVYLTYISDIYKRQKDYSKAIGYAQRSLNMAKHNDLKDQVSGAHMKLSEIYETIGNHQKSLRHYKQHIAYRDSVKNLEAVEQIADLRTDFEVSQKQNEIDLLQKESEIQELRAKRNQYFNYASITVLLAVLILAVGLYRRYRYIEKTKNIIEEEKNRSDNLLLNILPAETALELKQNGHVKAKRFDSVTVLFTDFKDFTQYAEKLSPEQLVEAVDYYYSKFDEIIDKYGMEKIKTLGDSYMCAGGIPFVTDDHAMKMVEVAIEIVDFVEEAKKDNDHSRFDIRIGINTGPIVAGVVGTKKFAYDIWGEAVNLASRMESNSQPGKINISENTYNLIKRAYKCKYRGEISMKHKRSTRMYFVNGRKV